MCCLWGEEEAQRGEAQATRTKLATGSRLLWAQHLPMKPVLLEWASQKHAPPTPGTAATGLRCRAYAQAVGCVPSVPGALTGPCAPSCPWEENRPQPLPSHEAVREEGLRKNRPLRWLLSSAEKGGASPLKQPTRVCPQVGCVVAGSLAHLVVQPTLVQGAEPGS